MKERAPGPGSATAVSIVIPTRNRHSLLEEAIGSVTTQSTADWEVVVVDNASTDGTRAWLESLDEGRIRVIRLDHNRERGAARNIGFGQACGAFALFLDDDDRLRPRALEDLLAAFSRWPAAVAAIGARIAFNDQGHRRQLSHASRESLHDIRDDLLYGWFAVPGQVLFRAAQLRSLSAWREDLIRGEDIELLLRVSRVGKVAIIRSRTLEYRVHGGQWRWSDEEAREQEWRESFLQSLPASDSKNARRAHRAGRLLNMSRACFVAGDYAEALAQACRAVGVRPAVIVSPLTGQPVRQLLFKSAVGVVIGRRAGAGIRGLKRRYRRLLKKDPEMQAPSRDDGDGR